jgi:hypothetical protein
VTYSDSTNHTTGSGGAACTFSRSVSYAIKLRTANDANGNSRRGWLVYTSDGCLRGFLDGYAGDHELYRAFPNAVITLATLNVTPGEYRAAANGKRVQS